MKAIFVQSAESVDYTPVADLAAGSVVLQGDLIGIAARPLTAGQPGALAVQGVFDVEKAAGTITAGTLVYWDNTNQVATTSASGNKLMGKAVRVATGSEARVRVLLNQ